VQAFQENEKKNKEECSCPQQIQCIVKNSNQVYYTCPTNANSFEKIQYVIDPIQKPKTSWISPG
jgi:hypothetical protein